MRIHIDHISIKGRYVVTSDDHVIPITNTLDEDGELCVDERAAFCVAGPYRGRWLTIQIVDGETVH